MMTCYVCRRKRDDQAVDDEDEYVYDVWFIVQSVFVQETGIPAVSVDTALSEDAAVELGERLREAVVEVMADRVEGMVWHDLAEEQAADFMSSLPDTMKSLAGKPLGTLTGLAGLPAPAASFSTDVVTTALLKPVLEPVESAVHAFEVAAIVIGLLAGLHPLVITCVKHLAHDELGSALSGAFEHLLSQAGVRASEQPSAVSTADAAADAGTVNDPETTAYQGLSLGHGTTRGSIGPVAATRPSASSRIAGVEVGSGTSTEEPPETRRHLRQLKYLAEHGDIIVPGQPMNDESLSAQPLRHVAGESGSESVDSTLAADTVDVISGLSALG